MSTPNKRHECLTMKNTNYELSDREIEVLKYICKGRSNEQIGDILFLSEKTLKALMVDTPSYVLLKKEVYDVLKEYGFYFLNSEFGEPGILNYDKFCDFLTSCSDDEFNNLFNGSFEKSKLNKLKLEEYIYSIKDNEIKLLIQTH